MRKLTVNTFVSLDGVMQAPGGPEEDSSGGFAYGGWVAPYWDERGGELMGDFMGKPFDLVLGRRTYEIFASYWPGITDEKDPVASALNRLPKYVASRTLKQADWRGTTIVRDGVKEASELKRRYAREVQIHGSGELIGTLLAKGLALPAYDQCIKASHRFNLLDARGVISVTERQSYILRVRTLAKACCEAWLRSQGELPA